MFLMVVSLVPVRGGVGQITAGTHSVMAPKCSLHVMFVMACNLLEAYIVLSLSTCCAFTHLILIIHKFAMFITFVYACVFKNGNKLDFSMRAH